MNQIDSEINATIEELYTNNCSKLRQLCNKEMSKFGGISQKDYDDFYSRVGWEISLAKNNYDPSKGKTFMEYIAGVIRFAIQKEMTDKNRMKRCNVIQTKEEDENGNLVYCKKYIHDVSIDTPIGDEDGLTIGDTLQSDFDMDSAVLGDFEDVYDEKMEKYLKNLSEIQRKIIELKMEEVPVQDILDRLHITNREYEQYCSDIKSFANISILYENNNKLEHNEEDKEMSMATQTMENCKTDRISIASIIKRIEKHTIRFDHPLQRESDQWSPSMKGNLISDILQGNKLHPLIFAEQIINGVPIIWDLDGKQRCTNAYSFSKNGYKVSKNIRRWMITYQTVEKDDNGNDILDENGFPIAVNAEFDIRGKKFSDLPEELRDRFLDYTFNYDQYLNCSEEDIGYHIERYNDGKPMTSPQKGITKLGTGYAEIVKSISNMPFFKDMGGYKVSEFKNGTINRVVVESVMAANYFDKWGKLDDMCKYIKENSDVSVFDNFEDMVERLEKAVTDETSDMFNSKDSFLWFGLFARFIKSETDDKRFIEFMTEFTQSLHTKKISGQSFDDILEMTKSTKDKGIVTKKMNHLIRLMDDFLHNRDSICADNESENPDAGQLVQTDVEDFISENVGIDKDTIQNDMIIYNETLDDLTDKTIRFGSKLLEKENRPSLLAMVAYSYSTDQDLDEWLADYAAKNNKYFADQKENYLYMLDDYEQYNRENKMSA